MTLRSHSVLASSGRETLPFSTGLRCLESARRDRVALRRSPTLAIAIAVAALTLASAADAQTQSCSTATGSPASQPLPSRNAPLDRAVSLHAPDLSLRAARHRISSAARR